MLAIKFRREGKKKQPSFRIVVTEKRSKIRGAFVENLGWYDPRTKKFSVSLERAERWIGNGAQPTDSVFNLLVRAGMPGKKRPVHHVGKLQSMGGVGAVSPVAADQKSADDEKEF